MKIACVGYREWACRIYDDTRSTFPQHEFLIFKSKEQFDISSLIDFDPEIILFYGWSWMVPDDITKKFMCVMLHPAPLPKYRGGSPIQNQIIRGETESVVTLFVMDEGIDTGDIVGRCPISLEGSLDEIFDRIYSAGLALTSSMLNGHYERIPQDHDKSTYYKRRKKSDSELTLDELTNAPADYLYNKIRMLADPYPNAFIKTSDGKKLLIKSAHLVGTDNDQQITRRSKI